MRRGPKERPSKQETQISLGKKVSSPSFPLRQFPLEEIHEKDKEYLRQLKAEIGQLSGDQKAEYCDALRQLSCRKQSSTGDQHPDPAPPEQSLSVPTTDIFGSADIDINHLKISKAVGGDLKSAAARIVAYFAQVHAMLPLGSDHQGNLTARRTITQAMLSDPDRLVLNSGGMQLLAGPSSDNDLDCCLFVRPETCWKAMEQSSPALSALVNTNSSIAKNFVQSMVSQGLLIGQE